MYVKSEVFGKSGEFVAFPIFHCVRVYQKPVLRIQVFFIRSDPYQDSWRIWVNLSFMSTENLGINHILPHKKIEIVYKIFYALCYPYIVSNFYREVNNNLTQYIGRAVCTLFVASNIEIFSAYYVSIEIVFWF